MQHVDVFQSHPSRSTSTCFSLTLHADVLFQKAELGAGPITMTLMRERAVDFTYPIYSFEAVSVRNKPPGPPSDDEVRTAGGATHGCEAGRGRHAGCEAGGGATHGCEVGKRAPRMGAKWEGAPLMGARRGGVPLMGVKWGRGRHSWV